MGFFGGKKANDQRADELRANRLGSLGARPGVPGQAPPRGIDAQRVREAFRDACKLPIGEVLADPDQPRKTFDPAEIEQIAASMRARGQLVPVAVRWVEAMGKYVLIDGERRLRAARIAGLAKLTCVVWEVSDPAEIREIQLVINALRKDVNHVEQADAWAELIAAKGYTHAELAARLGYDRSTITRGIVLAEAEPAIREAVSSGAIKPHTGIELARVEDPGEQAQLLEEAKAGRLKRDDLKGRGRKKAAGDVPTPPEPPDPAPAGRPGPDPIEPAGLPGVAWLPVATDRPPTVEPAPPGPPGVPPREALAGTRSRTFHLDGGAAVTVEAPGPLSDRAVVEALREALRLATAAAT